MLSIREHYSCLRCVPRHNAGGIAPDEVTFIEVTMKRSVSLLAMVVLGTLLAASGARGQWVQTNGPSGGYIRAFALMDTTSPVVFAAVTSSGSAGFGVFRSVDNGNSWTAKNNGLTNTDVWALATSGTTVFAGTRGGGVFRSTDSGATWTATNNGLANLSVQALAVSGSDLFAGTADRIFRSTNDGASWDSVAYGNIICLKVSGMNILAGTYGQGVYLSSNNGISWTVDTSGLTNKQVLALAASGDTVLAGTWGGGVFASTDNGSSWTADTTGLGGSGLAVYSLAVSGSDFFAGTQEGGIYRSTNNGTSWAAVNLGLTNTFGTALLPSGNNLLAGTINGIFLSTNDGTLWKDASNGLPVNTNVQAFTTIGQDSPSPMLFAGEGSNFRGNYLGGFFLSTDDGDNWQASNGLAANSDITALTVSGTNSSTPVIFAGTIGTLGGLSGLIYRSSDSGVTWSRAASGLSTWFEISALASIGGADTSTPIVFAGTTGAVGGGSMYRSTDNGTTWKNSGSGLASDAVTCFALIGSSNSSSVVFAGTFGGGVFRSTDSGSTWISGGAVGDLDVQALAVMGDSSASPLLFASTYTGVYLSTDSGRDWTSAGLDTTRIQTLAVSGSYLFAGAYNGGVYLCTDSGNSWQLEGLTSAEIQTLAIVGSNLYAGTYGFGVWRRPLSDFGISSVAPQPLVSAAPISVFPNPVTGPATIAFTSTAPGYANVRVVNQLGLEVARVFSGELSAGEHSFTLEPGRLTAGMYECIVRMNGGVQCTPVALRCGD